MQDNVVERRADLLNNDPARLAEHLEKLEEEHARQVHHDLVPCKKRKVASYRTASPYGGQKLSTATFFSQTVQNKERRDARVACAIVLGVALMIVGGMSALTGIAVTLVGGPLGIPFLAGAAATFVVGLSMVLIAQKIGQEKNPEINTERSALVTRVERAARNPGSQH